jgi:chromosome segregation ATPase
MKTRGFKSNISQMSDEKKTKLILDLIDEVEKSNDKQKVLNRKIIKLHKENQELKQEIQHLSTQLASNQPEMQREMQVETDIHDIKQDNLHTPSPPPPHLSPVNTDDVIRSVKRRLWRKTPSPRTPRTRNRRRANANRGGANKSCKL